MSYESLTVLIPSHSLEDLPVDLPENQAEGLLNAFAVLWHPSLLDAAGLLPRWDRADDPPALSAKSLVIVPTISRDWLACMWLDDAPETGATVISDVDERQALLARCLEPLDVPEELDPDVAADFLALGHCYLQMELLTRQMRYFSELDEARLESNVLTAARAALAGDAAAAQTRLRDCFEMLLESRERFYPVDCFLIDLCLLTPETADEHLAQLARSEKVVNYLATAADLQAIAAKDPDTIAEISDRWRDGRQEFVGGELTEGSISLLPLDATIRRLTGGIREFNELFGRRPAVYGRRKFGVGPQLPQLVDKCDFDAALHFVMDDGLYPDEEQGKFRWEGCDGTVVEATSRIPLAGDSAASFLRFPTRMSESMDYDHAAIVLFARWPELRNPWIDDFHRIHRYVPVLGRYVTLSEFFQNTDTPGRLTKFKAADYLSPSLLQSVAREETDPISRYADVWRRQHRFEAASWSAALVDLLNGRAVEAITPPDFESIDVHAADSEAASRSIAAQTIEDRCHAAERDLSQIIVARQGTSAGCFLVNPFSFARRVVIDWPTDLAGPDECPAIISRQRSDAGKSLVVEVPPCGFAWIPSADEPGRVAKPDGGKVALAEEGYLRNEFFEMALSEQTGGISRLKTYGRGPNRLSQQLAFRFRHPRREQVEEDGDVVERQTHYSRMQQTSFRVLSAGPGVGAYETTGTLVDPQTEELLAEFRQTMTVRRGRPLVEIDVELDVHKQPEGDPWSSYYACRWAWNDEDASLTASVHEGAHPATAERFEAPHYVEIASDDLRTTILPQGLPFHRKSGPRMLDTLLIVAGESRRRFRFVLALDEAYPMERARDCLTPVRPVVLDDGPTAPASGWFFHLDALNVQLTQLFPMSGDWPLPADGEASDHSDELSGTRHGVGLRLQETEGRHRTVRLRCFRTPRAARQRDLLGNTVTELVLDGDAVLVEVTAHELCDLEVAFADG